MFYIYEVVSYTTLGQVVINSYSGHQAEELAIDLADRVHKFMGKQYRVNKMKLQANGLFFEAEVYKIGPDPV